MSRPPQLRRRLVVISRDQYTDARASNPDLLADPFTTVVPVPLRPPLSDLPALNRLADRLQPGMLLIRNRWDGGEYVDAVTAYEQISLAKFNRFAVVCQLLGARELEVQEVREVTEKGEVTGSVDLRTGAMEVNGTGRGAWLNRMAQSVQARWSWQTGESDVDAAEATAREGDLIADPVVSSLIRQRRSSVNALGSHVLELDISSEAHRELEFAATVRSVLKQFGPSFAATLNRISDTSQSLRLKVSVTFH